MYDRERPGADEEPPPETLVDEAEPATERDPDLEQRLAKIVHKKPVVEKVVLPPQEEVVPLQKFRPPQFSAEDLEELERREKEALATRTQRNPRSVDYVSQRPPPSIEVAQASRVKLHISKEDGEALTKNSTDLLKKGSEDGNGKAA